MRQIIPFCKDIVFKTNIASITSISLEHEEKLIDGEVSGDFIIFGDYKIHNDTTEKELFKYRLPFTALIPDNIEPDTVDVDVENFTYEQVEEDVLKVNIDFSVKGDEKKEEVEEKEVERYEDVLEGVQLSEDIIKELNDEIDHFIENRKLQEEKEDSKVIEAQVTEIDDDSDFFRKEIPENEKVKEEEEDREEVIAQEREYVDTSNTEVVTLGEDNNLLKEDIITNDERPTIVNLPKKNEETKEEIEQVEQTEIKEVVSEYVTYHIHIINENETIDGILKSYGSNMDVVKEYNDISNIKVGDKIIIPEYLDE